MSVEIIDKIAVNSGCYATNVQQKAKPSSAQNSHYRKFYSTNPPFLVLHSLGCQRDSADIQADKWDNPNGQSIAHACVDARDGKTRQTLPWDFRGWHIGTDGNDIAIGVEMAESLSIKYKGGDKFDVLDADKARKNCRIAYEGAVELFAYLCGTFGVDPLGKREINGKLFPEVMSHNEYNRIRGASGHTDPEHYWTGLGMPYTMDGFRRDVKAKLNGGNSDSDIIYRIQVGAFRNHAYAEAYLARVQKDYPNAFIVTAEKPRG